MNVSLRTTACFTSNTTTSNNNTSAHKAVPSLLRWFFVLLMFGATTVNAQTVSSYAFGQSSGTYTPISGGTDPLNSSTWDDQTATSIPLGFTFTFNGTAYTTVNVNANGYITFGASASLASSPISSSTSTAGVVSAFGRDLINNGAGSELMYLTSGTSGSQVFTMQWTNARRYSGGGVAGDVLNFQIRLHETSNLVEIVYGTCTATSTSALTCQVGLRGTTNSDFNNRTSTTDWSATTAGASNSDAVTSSDLIMPASGLTFTFTAPGPCVTPTAQPTGLSLTPSGLSVLNGSFTAASPAPTGYLVVRTETNVAPAPVDGTSYSVGTNAIGYIESFGTATSFSSTGLLSNTTYYYWVFSYSNTSCSGGPLYLTTSPLTTSATTGACAISGTKTVGGVGADYSNLSNAIAALVNNGISGPVVLQINGALAAETYPITLPAVPCADATNTITIRPGNAGTVITASSTGSVFRIDGGHHYIIDGRIGSTGTTKDLTISNTNAAAGTAIRFINEASNNIVRYTTLRSSFGSNTAGIIEFAGTTGANGNDNNTIEYNDIDGGAGAAASPTTGVSQIGIYATGSTASEGNKNSGNIIANNNIFNHFRTGASLTNAGIYIDNGNTEWTITGNSIYQTNPRVATSTFVATMYGIYLNNNGNGFTVTNNFVGGSAPNAGGSAYTVSGGTSAHRMTSIGLNVGSLSPSSVQGNIITNINFSTSVLTTSFTPSTASILAGTWSGIIVTGGNVNVGTVTGNTIGSGSTNGAISVIRTGTSTSASYAIGIGVDGEGIVNISNNSVGGITLSSTGGTTPHSIYAIWSSSSTGGVTTINNNTVGSATTANSIQSAANTGTALVDFFGIYNNSTGIFNVANNLVANLSHNTLSSATTTNLVGIYATSGVANITGNTVRNLTSGNLGSATSHALVGIQTGSGTVGAWSINNNTIYNLSNTRATGAVYVSGIYSDGPIDSGVVARNNIYNLGVTSSTAIISGIYSVFGNVPYYNNTIRLGEVATDATINGIFVNSGTSNFPSFYHNTVYIGGANSAGANNTYALNNIQATNPHVFQNNIFINARSNGGTATGKHYAISLPGTTGLTIDYNIYRATGTGGVFGQFAAADVADLTAWKAATTQDANSKDLDPCLADPTAATPDLHLTNCATLGSPADGGGTPIAIVTDDMDGQDRSTLSPVDIGADAGDYGPSGIDVGIIALVRPTATSCHSATEDVIVTLKNFSTSDHDFVANPVTITTNITGQVTAGPLIVTINTGTLLAGANLDVTVGTVDASANGTYTFTSSASVTGDVTPGNDGNVTEVIINYTTLSVAITPGSSSICITGETSLLAVPTGGTAPFTYVWDAGTDLDSSYNTTGTITTTSTYNVTVTDACGITANASVTITVNNPTITSTTPGTRCGEGTVQLSATADPGGSIIKWYAEASGDTALYTGATFTTPFINSTTTYYVSASDGGGTFTGGGRIAPTSTSNVAPSDWGLVFDVTTEFTLVSFDVYPNDATPGNITIELQDNTGSPIQTSALIPIPAGDGSTPYTVSVGWNIPVGTGYRILLDGDINLIRESSVGGFPYAIGTAGSITSGYISGTSTTYYFMYNWTVSTGCEGVRTAVTATVTTPPAITATVSDDNICYGSSTTLNVTSPNDPGYTYTWYEDSLTGPTHIVTPLETTTYLLSAVDSSGGVNDGCATSAEITVTVNPMPEPVTINPSPAVACPGGVTLIATSGQDVEGTITGTSLTTIGGNTGNPYRSGYVANTQGKNQILILASELSALGFSAGALTSIGFTTTSVSASTALLTFTMSMKHTTATALTTAMEDPIGTTVYTHPGTFAPVLGLNVHEFQTPFYWDGTSNIVLTVCTSLGSTTTTTTVQTFTTPAIANTQQVGTTVTSCNANVTTATATSKPVMFIAGNSASPITWSPADGLNTTVGDTVIANPISETTYTATATLGECTTSNTVLVTLSTLAISASGTDITCFGGNNGTIDAVATGGTAPYEYSVDGTNWQASASFTGLIAGTYTVSVRDANAPNNCVATTTVVLDEPASAVTVTATGVDPVCNGASDGSVINPTGSGGAGGYTYTISGGSFTGLMAGTYTVTATDISGCQGTVDVTLVDPALPVVVATNSSPVCDGSDVILTATPGYVSYSWTGPGTINNANTDIATAVTPVNGDIFTVNITDANGCTNSASTTVTVNPNLPVSVNVAVAPSTEVCSGTNVSFTATPVNGGGSPTYQWYINGSPVTDSTNSTFSSNTLNDQDQVTVVMTSSEVCTSGNPATSTPITITITGAIEASVTISPVAPQICDGDSITIIASGSGTGNSPTYDFYINSNPVQSGSDTTYTYLPVNGDQVFVIMTSSYSCATNNPAVSNFETITVNPIPTAPTISADGPTTFCSGGSVTLTSSAVGGNTWSNGATTDAIVVTESGIYTATYTELGCASPVSNSIEVIVNESSVTITNLDSTVICSNEPATLIAVATPPAVSYLWTPNGETTDTIYAPIAGTYGVTTTDANGCTATASVSITVNDAPTASISGPSIICTGLTETLTASATAGSGTITGYQWRRNGVDIPGETGTTHTATINGDYTVVVTNSNGCITESAIHVLGLNGPMVGTYTVSSAPASCTNYNTLALAVYDLNNRGLGGNVIIDVEPGHTETAPAGGIVLNQCALAPGLESGATQTITIKKSAAGTNPLITAGTGTGTTDAIFANLGTDYVTIDGIDLAENVANTDSAMQMEYGYVLTNCGDNGVQYNLLQNNTVTLNKNNGNGSTGIYVLNNGTITIPAGASSNNKFYSNTISNVLSGIRVEGYADPAEPYALYGQNNEVGAAGLGNTITNWGNDVKSFAAYGVRTAAQNNISVVDNIINSTTGNNLGLVNGIAVRDSRWANSTITGNTVTLSSNQTGGSQFVGINNNSGSRFTPGDAINNTVTIDNNIITNSSYVGSGDLWLIGNFKPGADSLSAKNLSISGNQLTNNSNASTGTSHFYNIIQQVGVDNLTVNNNTITGNSTTGGTSRATTGIEAGFAQTRAGQTVQNVTISGNTISGNSTASTTGAYTGINTSVFGSAPQAGSLLTMSNNNVNNITATAQTTGAFTGMTTSATTNIDVVVTGNTVSNITRPSTLTSAAFNGIRATGASNPSVVMNNNTLSDISIPEGTSGVFTGIETSGSSTTTTTKSVSNNVVNNISVKTTGSMYLIDAGLAVTTTMNNNQTTNVERLGISGTMYVNYASTSQITYNGNTINNISIDSTGGSTSGSIYGYYNAGSPTVENITNNTITNINTYGTGTSTSSVLYGIYTNSTSGGQKDISGNLVHSMSSTTPATITGIYSGLGSVTAAKNKIYNLSSSSASTSALVTGITVVSGPVVNVNNNIIGDLRSTATAATDGVRGINITSTTSSSSVGLYFNTIYIDGTSSATNFGTTGIYTSTSTTATTATLDMRNNLVYNISVPKGTGRAVAYRRSSATLTNMGPDVNNNLYYVTGVGNSHVFSNGTAHLDLAGYKALSGIAPRESNSVTENVSFQSTVSSDANFMKVSTATPTLVEGGGQAIAGITTDYFGTTRAAVGPDIGAHEDAFQNIQLNFVSISADPSTTQCVATARTITAVMDEGAAPIVSVTLFYAFDGGTPVSVPMSNGGSGLTYTATIPAATPGNALVTWYVTATDGTYSPTTATQSYQDELLTGTMVIASANPETVCSGSPSVLTAQVSNPGTAQIGTGTSTNSTYPLRRFWGSVKTQMVYLASELSAAGLSAGPITSVGLDVSSVPSTPDIPNFKIFMKQTASTELTTTGGFETGMTEVYSTALYTPVVGINNYPVTSFNWDGTSNIIVEVCFQNDDGGGSSTSVRTSSPGFSATLQSTADNAPDYCANPTGSLTATSTVRPNLYFSGNTAGGTFTYVWSDGTNTVGTEDTITVNPLVTTNYTVTATNQDGCTITSAPVAVSVIPLAADSIEVSAAVCESGFSLTAHTLGGGEPYSYAWSDGSATVYPDAQTINPVLTPGVYNFSVTVTDGCGGNVVMNTSVTVNGLPTITVSSNPASGQVCGNPATLTAAGGVSYEWAPADGLSSTSGAVVQALPADTTLYTVTGTDANGCSNTATQLIVVEPTIALTASGTPATLCAGGDVQLQATIATNFDAAYTYAATTSVALADTTGSIIVVEGDVDDAPGAGQEIGFTFMYEGQPYTHFSASPDGFVQLRNNTSAASSDFSNDLEFPTNDPTIAPFWDDLNTGDATAGMGYVKAVVNGTTPNRVLVLHWYVTTPRNTSGAANSNFQALFYETTNVIEFRYDTIVGTSQTASVGIASLLDQGAYFSITTTDNSVSTTVDNNSVAAGPAVGTQYQFTPAVLNYTYSWSPNTDLDDATIANPLATNLQNSVDYVVTVTNPSTGCFVTDTVNVIVNPLPAATFTGLAATYCTSDGAVTLTGTPSNGTFSGPGISGNTFTPSVAGPGTHEISYSVTDISTGCSNSTTQSVTVTEPLVSFTGLDPAYCVSAGVVTLTGNQAPGGTFTGAGIIDNGDGTASFNPATAGAGIHNITYSYTDLGGCSASDVQSVTVNALPVVTISGLDATYCDNVAAVTITGNYAGGTFTGPGITDNADGTATFDPAVAGAGNHNITYTYTDGNGCTNSVTQPVTVGAGTAVSFSGLAATYCYDVENVVTLTGSPAGGTFSGNGISGNTFTPSVVGTYDITYSYNTGTCTNTAVQSVTVYALPTVSFSGLAGPYCADAAGVTLTGSPAGGTFSGPGMTGDVFDPATAGAGTWTIIYNYTDPVTGCSNSDEQQVTVNALPVVSITGLDATYCTTDAAVTLTGNPAGGTFSGPGMTGDVFDPAAAGVGIHVITYTYTDPGTGCSNSITQNVEVEVCTPSTITLNLKVFMEGFVNGPGTMMATLFDLGMETDPTATDYIEVNLWDPADLSSPTPHFTQNVIVHTDGTATITFPSTVNGNSYYIAVKHRNSIETWSKNPVAFTTSTSYDFSTGSAQAYDDGFNVPMRNVGGTWAMYGGDNNQDGTVDIADMVAVDNDAAIFAFGYNATDCTGDGASDLFDIVIIDNNAALFIFYARPY